MKYFRRSIEPKLMEAIKQFPVVLLTGPRQAGKSTLLQHCCKEYEYVTLDDPQLRDLAVTDPALFLSTHPTPLIIDKIQYAPELLSYIKIDVDQHRAERGRYLLTGSQIFQLMHGVSETLAGRIAILQLYPFSWSELESSKASVLSPQNDLDLAAQIVQGFYPEFLQIEGLDWNLWYGSYISTYLERDVRNIKSINDLSRFQTFLSLLATRVGSLLNLSELAKEVGISQPTAKDWLAILEATYVIRLLRPFHNNKTKSLVKSPKLYFIDTGLACYLLGIDGADRFLKAAERGHLFENMVIMEFIKKLSTRKGKSTTHFYRTQKGFEVDFLVDERNKQHAFEIKFSKKPTKNMAQSLITFKREHPDYQAKLLCLRESSLPLSNRVEAVHWYITN